MSLQPERVNLSVWADTTFYKSITFFEDEDGVVPMDLTGYTASLEIRATPADPVLLADLGTATGEIVLGGVAGTIVITIDAADVAAFTWRTAVYCLTVTSPGGQVDALLFGSFTVKGY